MADNIFNGMDIQVIPWRIPRKFDNGLGMIDWRMTIGKEVAIWRLVEDWFHMLRPGDQIELVDVNDLTVWQRGTVIFVKKIQIAKAFQSDIVSMYPLQFRAYASKTANTETLTNLLSWHYGRKVDPKEMAVVIGMNLEEVLKPDPSQVKFSTADAIRFCEETRKVF